MLGISLLYQSWYQLTAFTFSLRQDPDMRNRLSTSMVGRVAERKVTAEKGTLQRTTDYLDHIASQFFRPAIRPKQSWAMIQQWRYLVMLNEKG